MGIFSESNDEMYHNYIATEMALKDHINNLKYSIRHIEIMYDVHCVKNSILTNAIKNAVEVANRRVC